MEKLKLIEKQQCDYTFLNVRKLPLNKKKLVVFVISKEIL